MCQAYEAERNFVLYLEDQARKEGHIDFCIGFGPWCNCFPEEEEEDRD